MQIKIITDIYSLIDKEVQRIAAGYADSFSIQIAPLEFSDEIPPANRFIIETDLRELSSDIQKWSNFSNFLKEVFSLIQKLTNKSRMQIWFHERKISAAFSADFEIELAERLSSLREYFLKIMKEEVKEGNILWVGYAKESGTWESNTL